MTQAGPADTAGSTADLRAFPHAAEANLLATSLQGRIYVDLIKDGLQFFAVSLSANQEWVDRFIQIADIAIASGLTIRYSYNSGDYSGESFGCSPQDCRNPWGFALEKRANVP